jgi:riboflavin kinase / FMN adenylyltransferase
MAVVTLCWDEAPPDTFRAGALTIGNFDGVHRGHAALLSLLREHASKVGGPAVVLTFDPHPLQLLRPDQFLPVLTTPTDRATLLLAEGCDRVAILQTAPALLALGANEFFERVIRTGFQARAVVEGPNFGFGHEREGNVETLRRLCAGAGIAFEVAVPTERQGQLVSSNRVRSALLSGAVREAAELLGRPYLLRGLVGSGQRRGQRLGFPTANLDRLLP